jgi:ABC-type glutathione transport system ATPase component
MLDVRELRKSFTGPEGARVEVVRIPQFALAAGEERALRGESGCGKTTFLNLVAGILAARNPPGTGFGRPSSGTSSRPSTCCRDTPSSRMSSSA